MRVAEELSAALKMREENERLRMEQVDAVRAEAERLAQENLRMLMAQLLNAPRDRSQPGGGEPADEAAGAGGEELGVARG
jgi:hypothetical protein